MAEKTIILTHDGKEDMIEKTMSISKAEKMLSCRTTSNGWKFKDKTLSFNKKEGKIVFPKK